MSLSAITLPAESLYLLTDLGQTRLCHPRLPRLSLLENHHHIALHAADLPPDPALLEEGARWLGWSLSPGLTTTGDVRQTCILRPESERTRLAALRTGHNLRAVDLMKLPRGAVVAVAVILAERVEPHTGPTWYLGPITILPAPVAVDTGDWPCGRPWNLLPPALDAVRRQWAAAKRQPASRRSA